MAGQFCAKITDKKYLVDTKNVAHLQKDNGSVWGPWFFFLHLNVGTFNVIFVNGKSVFEIHVKLPFEMCQAVQRCNTINP